MRNYLIILTVFIAIGSRAQNPSALFFAQSAENPYYQNGFDTDEQFAEWSFSATGSTAWTRATGAFVQDPSGNAIDNYKTRNPQTTRTLYINFSNAYKSHFGLSPVITIKPNTMLSFWVCAGKHNQTQYNFNVCLMDNETGDSIEVFRVEDLLADSNYGNYTWSHQYADLSQYAGLSMQIRIHYWGTAGDIVMLEDFTLFEQSDQPLTIKRGETVAFNNYSTGGTAPQYVWTFEGGEPASSTESRPVVTYAQAGTYSVTLDMAASNGSTSLRREGYVIVKTVTPEPAISYPENAYGSPSHGCYIPQNTRVAFADISANYATQRTWTFDGANEPASNSETPEVFYPAEGTYDITLAATNAAGTGEKTFAKAVKVGGEADYAWNIKEDEKGLLAAHKLGSMGYFAGSNDRRIYKWAELFGQPLAAVTIDKVGIPFLINLVPHDADTTITVSVCERGEDGFPGTMLASASCRSSLLKAYDATKSMQENFTEFVLDKPVTTDKEFFVVVEGINPYGMSHPSHQTMTTVMASCPAREEGKNTVYVYLDSTVVYNNIMYFINMPYWKQLPTGGVSTAIAPHLKYASVASGIREVEPLVATEEKAYYDMSGRRLRERPVRGAYIIRSGGKATKHLAK